jgi:quercetin dioxygenase-like cupin family protein
MPFHRLDTLELSPFRPDINSYAELGRDLVMVIMEIGAGAEDTGHSHPFDQCGMVLSGSIEMFVGEEKRLLHVHDSYFLPAGIIHGWKTLAQPAILLDVTPKKPSA